MDRSWVTLKDLQKLTGTLSWVSYVFVNARPYLQRLFMAMKRIKNGRIIVTKEMKMDLVVWQKIISYSQHKMHIPLLEDSKYHIYTDASIKGLGGFLYDGNKIIDSFQVDIEDILVSDLLKMDPIRSNQKIINLLELIAIATAIRIWANVLSNISLVSIVNMHTDNNNCVTFLKKMYAKKDPYADILRKITVWCVKENFNFNINFIEGSSNVIADRISKKRFEGVIRKICIHDVVRWLKED